MCDQDQLIDMGKGAVSRREFGALGAMAALAACATSEEVQAQGAELAAAEAALAHLDQLVLFTHFADSSSTPRERD